MSCLIHSLNFIIFLFAINHLIIEKLIIHELFNIIYLQANIFKII